MFRCIALTPFMQDGDDFYRDTFMQQLHGYQQVATGPFMFQDWSSKYVYEGTYQHVQANVAIVVGITQNALKSHAYARTRLYCMHALSAIPHNANYQ